MQQIMLQPKVYCSVNVLQTVFDAQRVCIGMRNRRQFITGAATAGLLSLAGCAQSERASGQPPDPVDLSGQKTDFRGGMIIGDHGGPNGQVFYQETEPKPRQGAGVAGDFPDTLGWFHTLVYGLFPYHFEMRNSGAEAAAIYVTDYSIVDWELSSDAMTMPSPTSPKTFADATELTYVVGSDARGGMGATLLPFSNSDDATRFTDEYNGRTISYNAIDRELISGMRRQ
jgi:nitrous oxide reductase accessory protein NosL